MQQVTVSTIPPKLGDLKKGGKEYILCDSNVWISSSDENFQSDAVFAIIKSNGFTILGFHIQTLEVMATKNDQERITRQDYQNKHIEYNLPLTEDISKDADLIQQKLFSMRCFPGAVDLYLAAILKKYSDSLYLLTRDSKDFPVSLFPRKGYIVMDSERHSVHFSLLSIDASTFTD